MPKRNNNQPLLDQMITLRVSAQTRSEWQARARAAGVPLGDWLRSQIADPAGRRPLPRRKPPPPVDPALLAAIARIGNNLNQLARAANRQQWPAPMRLLAQLIRIERAVTDQAPPRDD